MDFVRFGEDLVLYFMGVLLLYFMLIVFELFRFRVRCFRRAGSFEIGRFVGWRV